MQTNDEILPGLRWAWAGPCFYLHAAEPLQTISSAVVGGGIRKDIRWIMNITVPRNYNSDRPHEDVYAVFRQSGIPEEQQDQGIGLLTAVDVRRAKVASVCAGNASVTAIVTAGTENALRVGTAGAGGGVGTVNVIAFLEGRMPDSALVNAVITITEAKAAVFQDMQIPCAVSGRTATGTTTDAVVFAATERGTWFPYAGPGTDVGVALAQAVQRALREALSEERKGGAQHAGD